MCNACVGVHVQCMRGGTCAMHAWGVHMQMRALGCTRNACMGVHMQCACGGCMHNAYVGGAHAMHTLGCTCNACGGVTPIN